MSIVPAVDNDVNVNTVKNIINDAFSQVKIDIQTMLANPEYAEQGYQDFLRALEESLPLAQSVYRQAFEIAVYGDHIYDSAIAARGNYKITLAHYDRVQGIAPKIDSSAVTLPSSPRELVTRISAVKASIADELTLAISAIPKADKSSADALVAQLQDQVYPLLQERIGKAIHQEHYGLRRVK